MFKCIGGATQYASQHWTDVMTLAQDHLVVPLLEALVHEGIDFSKPADDLNLAVVWAFYNSLKERTLSPVFDLASKSGIGATRIHVDVSETLKSLYVEYFAGSSGRTPDECLRLHGALLTDNGRT